MARSTGRKKSLVAQFIVATPAEGGRTKWQFMYCQTVKISVQFCASVCNRQSDNVHHCGFGLIQPQCQHHWHLLSV